MKAPAMSVSSDSGLATKLEKLFVLIIGLTFATTWPTPSDFNYGENGPLLLNILARPGARGRFYIGQAARVDGIDLGVVDPALWQAYLDMASGSPPPDNTTSTPSNSAQLISGPGSHAVMKKPSISLTWAKCTTLGDSPFSAGPDF
jgi:hypothetical protein